MDPLRIRTNTRLTPAPSEVKRDQETAKPQFPGRKRIKSIADKMLQKQQVHVSAKHRRRFQAIMDVLGMIAGLPGKVGSVVAGKLFPSRPKTSDETDSSRDAAEQLRRVAQNLSKGENDIFSGITFDDAGVKTIEKPGVPPHLEQAVVTLRASMEAAKSINHTLSETAKEKLQSVLNKADGEKPDRTIAKEVKKIFQNEIKDRDSKNLEKFKSEYIRARGNMVPKTLKLEHEIPDINNKVRTLTEKMTVIETSDGANYLEKLNIDSYSSQIDDSRQNMGIRPSERRIDEEAQGTSINLHVHTISEGDHTLETVYRGGAFAVHGDGKTGIARLKTIQNMTGEQEVKALKQLHKEWLGRELHKKWNVNKEENITKMKKMLTERLKYRTHMTVAQALPKVLAAVRDMAKDPDALAAAAKTGSFLYTEQSFVSDQEGKELMMLEDTKGALDHISENLHIVFGDTENLEVKDGKITVTLARKNLPPDTDINENQTFGVNALLFAQGVNETQSIGQAKKGGESYQDTLNKNSVAWLLAYAEVAEPNGLPEIQELKKHYSINTARNGKDLVGVKLIANATKALKGRRGIHCKSGKDRTGTDANDELGRAAAKILMGVSLRKDLIGADVKRAFQREYIEKRKECQEAFSGGLSLHNVNRNNERFKYAFNNLQLATLHERWSPPARFCGSASS